MKRDRGDSDLVLLRPEPTAVPNCTDELKLPSEDNKEPTWPEPVLLSREPTTEERVAWDCAEPNSASSES